MTIKDELMRELIKRLMEDDEFDTIPQCFETAIDLTIQRIEKLIDNWLNTYCTHGGHPNCVECIQELLKEISHNKDYTQKEGIE